MTARELLKIDHPDMVSEDYSGGCYGCPSSYGYLAYPEWCTIGGECCIACWNREIPDVCKNNSGSPHILDSGNRREFETGAVRDIQEGKGRCDLMPLDVVADFLTFNSAPNSILSSIYLFQDGGREDYLFRALDDFNELHWKNNKTMLLEVSKHFEDGAKKYGENNWQKGISVHCYIDSAVRHYLKFLRDDKDEPHDRAFVWNIMCAIWTCKHKPELNEYSKKE